MLMSSGGPYAWFLIVGLPGVLVVLILNDFDTFLQFLLKREVPGIGSEYFSSAM